MSEMEASMDRVDRNVCNAHAFVLITNQQHFQSGEHPKVHSWTVTLFTLVLGTNTTNPIPSQRGPTHLWSHQLGGNGRWCWGRPSAWFSHGSSVGGSELWNFWVAERGEEQSQNWCIMEIYEFYLTFTCVIIVYAFFKIIAWAFDSNSIWPSKSWLADSTIFDSVHDWRIIP